MKMPDLQQSVEHTAACIQPANTWRLFTVLIKQLYAPEEDTDIIQLLLT